MGGGNLAHNSKKKGFAISGILYPLLILTLFLVVQMLFMLQTRKNILDKARTELADSINKSNQVYTNEELSTLITDQQKKNELLENTVNVLQNKINSLESNKLDKSYKEGGVSVKKMPIGRYFSSDPNNYVIIKLGNLKFSSPSMIMASLKMYQYGQYNSMLIGGYLYTAENYIYQPSISYLQKANKIGVSLGVKNDSIYIILNKGAGGYYGFYVEEMMVAHVGGGTDIVDSGWEIYSTNSISDFNKVYNCVER